MLIYFYASYLFCFLSEVTRVSIICIINIYFLYIYIHIYYTYAYEYNENILINKINIHINCCKKKTFSFIFIIIHYIWFKCTKEYSIYIRISKKHFQSQVDITYFCGVEIINKITYLIYLE